MALSKIKILYCGLGLLSLVGCGGGGGGGGSSAEILPAFNCTSTGQALTSSAYGANPLFNSAWHLKNTGIVSNSTSGEDLNLTSTWGSGITGECVVVAVVDDGIEIDHEDLKNNILAKYSYNYSNRTNDPTPSDYSDSHGTSVAGIIAAASNTVGGLGVAPNAKLVGFVNTGESADYSNAMIGQPTTGASRFSVLSISNNSWGYPDNTGALQDGFATGVWKSAVEKGVTEGRGGKGMIYLWASGNGAEYNPSYPDPRYRRYVEDSNYDGQANYRYVIAVGGADSNGQHPDYAEPGANVLVAGLTQGSSASNPVYRPGIVTSTISGTGSIGGLRNQNYTDGFNGTSAATPTVAGVVALMLQANSNLTWRQVRWILAATARKNNPTDSGWLSSALGQNGAGKGFNHKYGYGVPDASAAVTMAVSNPPTLGTLQSCVLSGTGQVGTAITSLNTVSFAASTCPISTVEFVELEFDFAHSYFRDLGITLSSPSGNDSVLAEQGTCDSSSCNFSSGKVWTFGSVRHMNESVSGNWVLKVRDLGSNGSGTLNGATLIIWGF